MMDWIDHNGERDPAIPGDTRVCVLFRDGDVGFGIMHDWDQNWQWSSLSEPHDGDIIGYKVLSDTDEDMT